MCQDKITSCRIPPKENNGTMNIHIGKYEYCLCRYHPGILKTTLSFQLSILTNLRVLPVIGSSHWCNNGPQLCSWTKRWHFWVIKCPESNNLCWNGSKYRPSWWGESRQEELEAAGHMTIESGTESAGCLLPLRCHPLFIQCRISARTWYPHTVGGPSHIR